MAQPLTPPPSLRVLRVRTRTRTSSDENRRTHVTSGRTSEALAKVALSRKDISTSPSRGRTRSRVVRNPLTLNTAYTRPHLSLALPSCCSPPPTRGDVRAPSPGYDDDLIFQMSPIQSQSPSSLFFDASREGHKDEGRAKQSTAYSLSTLWEKHKASLTTSTSQTQTPRTPSKRTRTNTVTQHQRGFSDTHASITPRRTRQDEHQHKQSAKTLLDFSTSFHVPPSPLSPTSAEPFMYSFPNFESNSLNKARQDRARRQAGKAYTNEEYLTGDSDSASKGAGPDSILDVDMTSNLPQRLGPIKARKLRIQSGGPAPDDLDDANLISRAFQSASLDPEKYGDVYVGDDEGGES